MEERRRSDRFVVSFPIRVEWKDENGINLLEEGLTENVGVGGTLIHLPRLLPNVGSEVNLTILEDPKNEITVTAQVLRLERNAAHPQAALMLTDNKEIWEKGVWEYAADLIANEKPEEWDDWN
jgi:hypothetical protein